MSRAIATIVMLPRTAPGELARAVIVAGCALALILAGPPLHF